MFEELKKEDAITNGLLHGLCDSVNSIVEECDSAGLKEANQNFLTNFLTVISDQNKNPQAITPNLNEEQRELLINNYCGSVQVFLVRLGKERLNQELCENIVKLCLEIFTTNTKVTVGGLLIFTGLLSAIEGEFQIFFAQIKDYLISAINF